MALRAFLPKSLQLGGRAMAARSPWSWSPRVLVTNTPGGPFDLDPTESPVNPLALDEEVVTPEDSSRGICTDTARVCNSANRGANKVAETAQDLSEKVKETVQQSWGTAKATAQNLQETVADKAEQGKESIKETADTVKRAMDSKNY